ncbi:MAG: hypothetical protein PHD88_02050 [Firmicutes bacterium]|nr:hypothetical protein [Bacillota bacterium]MDD4262953.1 hypothetical protein [Bacillota bacterium]MDD4693174.1 hypothetical protein [Bacillota bacterium]
MTKKYYTALALIFIVIISCASLVFAEAETEAHEFKILVGSGLLNSDEANSVLQADNSSPYELASLIGRAWTRVIGIKNDSFSTRFIIDVPAIFGQIPELKLEYTNLTIETLESLMGLTYRYRSELSDLGYGFYLGSFAVYQEQDHLTLYGLWNEDKELETILTEMVRPFVASYTEEIADWARFKLEYVALSEMSKRLAGEIQLGNVSVGGALSANRDEPYRFEAAVKVGEVQVGAGFTAGSDLRGNRLFEIPDLGFSLKLGEVQLATYLDDPVYSYIYPDGHESNDLDFTDVPPNLKEQIDIPQVTSLVVGIPIWQRAVLRAGLLYGEVNDQEKGVAITKGATAGIKINIMQASIQADYQYYNRENETESNTARLKLGYGITDSTYINLAYRLVTSSEKLTGKTADENLATAEISIQF